MVAKLFPSFLTVIWSRAVQKLTYDIITPLSTVALNLKVMQTRLKKIELKQEDEEDLSDDINMIQIELVAIQSTTKIFYFFPTWINLIFRLLILPMLVINHKINTRLINLRHLRFRSQLIIIKKLSGSILNRSNLFLIYCLKMLYLQYSETGL